MDVSDGPIHCTICDSHEHSTSRHHEMGKHIGHELMEGGATSFNSYFHKKKGERTEGI